MDCSLPGSSVHEIFLARILAWVVISFSRGCSWPWDWTHVTCTTGEFFTAEPPGKPCFVQFSSVAQSCLTICDPMDCSMPGFPVHPQLPELTQTHVHPVSDTIQPPHPLHPLLFLPSIFPIITVFSNESVLPVRWTKYWSFNFNISPSNEHPGLISFRMNWLDVLAVQGTLKSFLQHHSSKASILWHSAFFIVHLSIHTWLLEKSYPWLDGPLLTK